MNCSLGFPSKKLPIHVNNIIFTAPVIRPPSVRALLHNESLMVEGKRYSPMQGKESASIRNLIVSSNFDKFITVKERKNATWASGLDRIDRRTSIKLQR
uniref:Uncharacterized protein n=1 Tax=Syphacia muris TaxID=451379 RepID=A0A0N5AEW7_9BILA